jgi:site-specific recombinase XerC
MKTPDPLFDAVQSFFVDHLKLLRGSSQTTLKSYRDTLRLFFEYASSIRKTSVDRLCLTDLDADLISAFLQHQEQDPFSGHVFVFRGRRGDLIKLLWWDGDGLCLFAKRLERGC